MKKIKKFYIITFVATVILNCATIALKKLGIISDVFFNATNFFKVFLSYFLIIELILVLAGYGLYDFFSKKSQGANQADNLKRLEKAAILKYLFFGLAGFINFLLFLVYYHKNFVYLFLIILIFFLLNIPTYEKFKRDFNI